MKGEKKVKKKVLFPIMALVLALGLWIPMAAPVGAATTTLYPVWEVTNNTMVDSTIGTATPWTDAGWGGWNSSAWPGPSNGIYGDIIPYWVVNDTWMDWLHGGTEWTQYTHMWFRTTVNIPTSWVVTSVNLTYKYNENILPINDALYVYVDGTYCAAGGTATDPVVAPLIPAPPPDPIPYGTFVTALGVDFTTAPETGWYLNDGLSLPASLFTPGNHDIHVLAEEMDISGGLGHMVFKVEYEIASIDLTKFGPECAHEGDIITYNYSVHNNGTVPLDPPVVTDNLSITVIPVTDSVHNVGDTDNYGVFDPCETWNFTASYAVPSEGDLDYADPLVNEATATAGLYDIIDLGDTNPQGVVSDTDTWSVDIFHPSIEVTKSGPEGGYFQSIEAEYDYEVHNDGDCSLTSVSVTDDLAGSATYVSGDNDNGLLDPCETWVFTASALLECTCETITCFTNKATAEGTDTQAMTVTDSACWTVLVFQWQPRTIGYWGNWDNHYTNDEIAALVNAVERQSCYFGTEGLEVGDVHDLLLGRVKGRMTVAKATALLEKQLLATWFNVKSYEDWVGDITIPTFEGSPDAAMDPNATVYVDGEAMTVQEILDRIEYNICTHPTSDIQFLLKAKDILDDLNNAESNGYEMFIPPWFDADACPLVLENKDSSDWSTIVDDMYGKLFYNDAGDEFEYIFCGCGLDIDTDYSLIYYADFINRYVDWGGNNPGALIAEMTTDGCGSVFKAGSVELDMDLPSCPDANIAIHDYSGAPDFYAHAHGAKIWLVPSDCYDAGAKKVDIWSPDDFLFETDLITYDDTDVVTNVCP